MSSTESRRLAAIVFTDMVGFTTLSQRDESLALELLEEHRQIIRGILPTHGGREVKTIGDGFLIEFSNALAAVRAAVEIQYTIHERNAAGAESRQFLLRIGIHLGDVVLRDGDIHGDGVNIAARIEPLAAPGGVCVSNAVYDQVRNKLKQPFAPMASAGLKNVEFPMQVHRVQMPWDQPNAVPGGVRGITWWKIAFPAAAIATVLIFGLWRPWRDQTTGPRVAVTPATANQPKSDAKQLSERARDVYEKVGFTREDLTVAEEWSRRATELEPSSAYAWSVRAGVQSGFVFREWDQSEKRRQETEKFANRALALNPDSPEALLALGRVLSSQGGGRQAETYLRRALALQPNDGRILRALAGSVQSQGRWADGRSILQDAIERNPRDVLSRYSLAVNYFSNHPANVELALEQLDAALAVQSFTGARIQRARLLGGLGDLVGMRAEVDRIPPEDFTEERTIYLAMWAGLMERKPERVIEAAALTAKTYFEDRAVAGPKAWPVALAYQLAGKEGLARLQWQNAEAVLRERLRERPNDLPDQARLAVTLAALGRTEEAAQAMGPVEQAVTEGQTLRSGPELRLVPFLAFYQAMLGDSKKAIPFIRDPLTTGYWTTGALLAQDPWWDKLRGQPEFEALVAEMKPKAPGSR